MPCGAGWAVAHVLQGGLADPAELLCSATAGGSKKQDALIAGTKRTTGCTAIRPHPISSSSCCIT